MKEKLLKVFRETFSESNFNDEDFETLTINSIDHWDSIGNLNLLMNVESSFSIRLTSQQLSETKSIKDILKILENN